MRVENIIFDLISENAKVSSSDREALMLGIKQYVIDNHLEQLVEMQRNNDISVEMVKVFLEPILLLPSDKISSYFEHYCDMHEFDLVSKRIAYAAECAYYHKACDIDIDEMERIIIEFSSKLYKYNDLKIMIDAQMSENLLDIDFIRGKTSNMSLRLSRKIRTI